MVKQKKSKEKLQIHGDLEGKLKSEILEEIDFNNPNGSGHGIENINNFRKRIFEWK